MTPSPNLLAATLASNTKNAAILVIGDSLALYNPPTRVAEEMAYLDCLSDGRLIAGFVFGTPMDSTFSYGIPPSRAARTLPRGARTDPALVAGAGAVRLQRQVHTSSAT